MITMFYAPCKKTRNLPKWFDSLSTNSSIVGLLGSPPPKTKTNKQPNPNTCH